MIGYKDLMNMIGKLNVEHQARIVIEINDPKNIFEFAKNVKNASIEEQTKIIIIEKLAKAIIKIKNAEYIYKFARYIPGAPIKELAFAILATKDLTYIFKFARYVKNAPMDKITKYVIKNCNAWHIYRYAECMGGNKVSLSKLADAVIKKGDAESIYYFAKYVKGAPIDKLAKGIAKCDYSPYFDMFIYDIKTAPIDKIVNIVIRNGSFEHLRILLSNKEIRNKYFDKLVKALINKVVYWRMETVIEDHIHNIDRDGLDKKYIDKLVNAIIATNDGILIDCIATSMSIGITKLSNKIGESYKELEEIERIKEAVTYIKGELINKLVDAVIATKDLAAIEGVMLDVKDAPINKLATAIIEIGGADKLIYLIKTLSMPQALLEALYDAFITAKRKEGTILIPEIHTKLIEKCENAEFPNAVSLLTTADEFYPLIGNLYWLSESLEKYIDEKIVQLENGDYYFELEIIRGKYLNKYKFTIPNKDKERMIVLLRIKILQQFDREIRIIRKYGKMDVDKLKNKSINKPKVNTTLEKPKRYVRTRK